MSTPSTIDLGKIRFDHRGDWASATNYEINDIVMFAGSSWACIKAGISENEESGRLGFNGGSGQWYSGYPSTDDDSWKMVAQGAIPMTNDGQILTVKNGDLYALAVGDVGQVLKVVENTNVYNPGNIVEWGNATNVKFHHKRWNDSVTIGTAWTKVYPSRIDIQPESTSSRFFVMLNAQCYHGGAYGWDLRVVADINGNLTWDYADSPPSTNFYANYDISYSRSDRQQIVELDPADNAFQVSFLMEAGNHAVNGTHNYNNLYYSTFNIIEVWE